MVLGVWIDDEVMVMPQTSYDLSIEIARDIEYYSDRWNPERLDKIENKLRILEKMLRSEMAYSEKEWDDRIIYHKKE